MIHAFCYPEECWHTLFLMPILWPSHTGHPQSSACTLIFVDLTHQFTMILSVSAKVTKDRQLVCRPTAGKQQSPDPVPGLPSWKVLIPVSISTPAQWFSKGGHAVCPPGIIRQCLGIFLICRWGKGGNANGIQGPRPGSVLSLLHCIRQPYTMKNYLGQNLNSAAVEKSCSSIYQNLSYFNISECNSIIFLNSDLHFYWCASTKRSYFSKSSARQKFPHSELHVHTAGFTHFHSTTSIASWFPW